LKRNKFIFINLFLLSVILLGQLLKVPFSTVSANFEITPEIQAYQTPSFNKSSCMFKLPIGVVEGEDVICGYVDVPEQHSKPEGPKIQLAVAVLKNRSPNHKPDPLFMAQGGPGGSTIDTYAEILLSGSRLINNGDRDIVLFDQRGTLNSRPKLMCPEIDQLTLNTINKDLSEAESNRLEIQAMQTCHSRLIEEGIDLSDYDTPENAADIENIRQALGYEDFNLYGVSYGTLLALETMRLEPDHLRSVILDGVVPPQINFLIEIPQTTQRAFTYFFQACAEDESCNQAYPNLKEIFYDLVKKFDQDPVHVSMTDPESGITYQAVVDGQTFLNGLFQMLYSTSLIPALPRMIYDAKDGNFDFFGRIMSILVFDRTFSYGMYYSVLCAEDADFTPADVNTNGVNPVIKESEANDPEQFLKICSLWNVNQLGQQADRPVTSDIPTLILSGDFDPITPPSYGEIAAETLPNSYVYVFPSGGHGQALESPCSDSIILSFLDNPNQAPDESCIPGISKPVFYTPDDVISIPNLVKILNLEGNSGVALLALIVASIFLLSAWLIFPLVWLITYLRSKRSQSGLPSENMHASTATGPSSPWGSKIGLFGKAAPWMALLAGGSLLIFLIVIITSVVQLALQNNNILFFGLPSNLRGWFSLPLLAALLTLGVLITSLLSWFRHYWNIWLRIYFTLLSLSAITCILILARWGILTALV
jgi:pimeloyl-ACP methyl ester carboxylesterase